MNKFILTFISALFFLSTHAQTSVYHPFPDSNAVWNFHYSINCPVGGWPVPEADFSIIIAGDTTINGFLYKKLYSPFVSAGPNPNNCPLPDTGYQGVIRQDILNKKVYVIPKYTTTEQLYFDFNYSVNDTITGFLSSYFFIVQSVDSVLIGNSYRKKWMLNQWFNAYVIEGIGFNYGLIHQTDFFSDGPGYSLKCFNQNNQTLYPDTTTVCELITVSVNEHDLSSKIHIYPNPASEEINILFNIDKPGDIKLQFINSLGQKIKSVATDKLNMGENRINIPVDEIPNGVYFIKIIINENFVNKRIIKI